MWVTLRDAGRGVIPSGALWQFDAYAWYFPYVNERLRRLDRARDDLVLAEWDRVSKRTGVTYDAIVNPRGASLMARTIHAAIDGAADDQRPPALPPGGCDRPVVVQPQERDHVVGVLLGADGPRRPPRARKHVVGPDPPRLQQLVAHALGKGDVGEPVAVHVAQLAPPEPELDPPKLWARAVTPGQAVTAAAMRPQVLP